MADALKNFAISTVVTAPAPATSGTTLVVTTGHGTRFPAVPFNATVKPSAGDAEPDNAEIVRVTNITGDTLTITRAQESTTARAIVAGDRIFQGVTAKTFSDLPAELIVPLYTEFKMWSNMPSALSFYGGSTGHQYAQKMDLSRFRQVRFVVNKQGTAGAIASKLILRYATSFSTSNGAYSDIGTSEVSVAVNVSNTFLDTGWIDLAAGAIGEVYLVILGSGGDGALDPTFGSIVAKFQ